jgi:hypothetical protein
MMQPGSYARIRPVEQAGRLLGSIVAEGNSRSGQPTRRTGAGSRSAALDVWVKVGRRLAGSDDVEAFVRSYQDAFQAYRPS